MNQEENLRKILGKAFGEVKPKPEVQKVYPSIKEFMQRTTSDWMKRGYPAESYEFTFKNSAGRRCRVKFEVELL